MTSTRLPSSDVCVRMPDLRLTRGGVPHQPTQPSDSHHATPDMPPLGTPGNPPWRNLGPSAHEARLVDAMPTAAMAAETATEVSPAATSTTARPQRGREPRALRRWGTQLGVTIAAAVLLAVVHHALTAPATHSTPETAPVIWSSDQVVLGTPVPMTEAQPDTAPESPHAPAEDGPDTQMNDARMAQRLTDATGQAVPPPQDSEPTAAELPPPLPASDDVNGGPEAAQNGAAAGSPESAYAPPEMPSPADPPSDATAAPPLVDAAALPDSNITSNPAHPSYPLTAQHDAPKYLLQDPVPSPAPSGPAAASPPSAGQATTPAASPYPYTNNPFAQPLQPSGTPGPTARLDKKIMTTSPTAIPPVQR